MSKELAKWPKVVAKDSNIQPNDRIAFDCGECGKNLQLTGEMYSEYYAEHGTCLSCRKVDDIK